MEQITREEMMGLLLKLQALAAEENRADLARYAARAIAALQAAEPVGANTFACHCAGGVVITTDPATGQCVAVTRQDDEGRVLSTVWEATQPTKAQVPEGWRKAISDAQQHLTNWLEIGDCDCEGPSHYCGRVEVTKTCDDLAALLTASPAPNNDKDGCTCQGCGIVYAADLIVPDEWWEKIKPEGKAEGSGLLCPTCIMDRLVEKGWSAGHIASSAPDHATDASKLVEALEKIEAYEIKSSPTATDFGVSFDRARWIGGMKEIARAALAEYRQQEEAER